MVRQARRLLALALVAALAPTAAPAQEEPSAQQVRPSYSRARAERGDVPEPEARELPEALRLGQPRTRTPAAEGDSAGPGAADTRPGSTAAEPPSDLDQRAREAAAWAAAETIRRHGLPRYFEVGFHEGMHDAIRRTGRDRWELEQGRREGRFDPEARRLGEQIGVDEADLASAEGARQTVAAQFADLGREPLPLPPPPPPRFSADRFAAAPPELRDVFSDLSWRAVRAVDLDASRVDPWRLYEASRREEFYEEDWCTARFGLDLWRKTGGAGRWFRDLDAAERGHFEQSFAAIFEAELSSRFGRAAERAFEGGYDAGWRHGFRVGREWQYRQGYHQGFESAVRETAQSAFARRFPAGWQTAYGDLFHDWSTTVKLEVRSAWLRDGNDDGVFEPGEELFAELDLVNLGGGSGRLDARLEGSVLADAERRSVDFARRSAVPRLAALRATIRPGVAPPVDGSLRIAIGDLTHEMPLRVSYVLSFEGEPRLTIHDASRGTATVDLFLINTSRRAVPAWLEARLPGASLLQPQRSVAEIPAGGSRRERFEVHAADPLALIGGELVLSVVSETDGRMQDRLEARLPNLATDLDDSSLVDLLVQLGRSPAADRRDIERAHQLMLRRLEADWQVAVRARGNPYKSDLRGGAATTALGKLVEAAARGRAAAGDRANLSGLVPRIEALSRTLPGTHPFLRISMRKLARKLL